MEWHGGKMLPKGLPELTYQVTLSWILRDLKVVIHPRKEERGTCGNIGRHGKWWWINLYPTNILRAANGFDIRSFSYWYAFLRVMLHEIGHIMTLPKKVLADDKDKRYDDDFNYRRYVEWQAEVWCEMTMVAIGKRDPRLGQPEGWIGGLPGIYLHRRNKIAKFDGKFDSFKFQVLRDYRAYQCGGQLSLTEAVNKFFSDYLAPPYYFSRMRRRFREKVKTIAESLAIDRHYEDRSGRKHLFFNHGEYLAIVDELRKYILQNDLTEQMVKEFTGFDEKVKEAARTLVNGKKGIAENKPEWFPGLTTFNPLDIDDDIPF